MNNKKVKRISPIKNFIWSLKELNRFKKSYIFVLLLNAVIKGLIPVIK